MRAGSILSAFAAILVTGEPALVWVLKMHPVQSLSLQIVENSSSARIVGTIFHNKRKLAVWFRRSDV